MLNSCKISSINPNQRVPCSPQQIEPQSSPTPPSPTSSQSLSPQTQAVSMNYVGFWRRIVAALIDVCIYFPLAMIVFFMSAMFSSVAAGGAVNDVKSFALNFTVSGYILSIVLLFLYYVILQKKMGGQTPGKRVMRIKVVNKDGQTPSMMTFVVREMLIKDLSILIPNLGLLKIIQMLAALVVFVGFLMVLGDSKKQALHDKIAKTYVIYA